MPPEAEAGNAPKGVVDLGNTPVHLGTGDGNRSSAIPVESFGFDGPSFEKYIEQYCSSENPGRLVMVETTPADWRRSISITLDSAYVVLAAAVPKMKVQGGSVVAIASVASSTKGFARRAAYGAAKGGVIGLTKACAADYLPNKLRFNAVCPATVDSPSLRERITELAKTTGSLEAAEKVFLDRQPSGRLGTAEEIAGLCAYLASEDGRFVTGQAINIDGGITI